MSKPKLLGGFIGGAGLLIAAVILFGAVALIVSDNTNLAWSQNAPCSGPNGEVVRSGDGWIDVGEYRTCKKGKWGDSSVLLYGKGWCAEKSGILYETLSTYQTDGKGECLNQTCKEKYKTAPNGDRILIYSECVCTEYHSGKDYVEPLESASKYFDGDNMLLPPVVFHSSGDQVCSGSILYECRAKIASQGAGWYAVGDCAGNVPVSSTTSTTVPGSDIDPPSKASVSGSLESFFSGIGNWVLDIFRGFGILSYSDAGSYDVGDTVSVSVSVSSPVSADSDYSDGSASYLYGKWVLYKDGVIVDSGEWTELSGKEFNAGIVRSFGDPGKYALVAVVAKAKTEYDYDLREWGAWTVEEVGKDAETFTVKSSSAPSDPGAPSPDFLDGLWSSLGGIWNWICGLF